MSPCAWLQVTTAWKARLFVVEIADPSVDRETLFTGAQLPSFMAGRWNECVWIFYPISLAESFLGLRIRFVDGQRRLSASLNAVPLPVGCAAELLIERAGKRIFFLIYYPPPPNKPTNQPSRLRLPPDLMAPIAYRSFYCHGPRLDKVHTQEGLSFFVLFFSLVVLGLGRHLPPVKRLEIRLIDRNEPPYALFMNDSPLCFGPAAFFLFCGSFFYTRSSSPSSSLLLSAPWPVAS